MEEKRRFPRVGISFPTECDFVDKNGYFYTVTRDLSAGGIRITSDKFIPKGSILKLNINLINKVIPAEGEVVWTREEKYSEKYILGLKFLQMEEKSRKVLNDFLDYIINS